MCEIGTVEEFSEFGLHIFGQAFERLLDKLLDKLLSKLLDQLSRYSKIFKLFVVSENRRTNLIGRRLKKKEKWPIDLQSEAEHRSKN